MKRMFVCVAASGATALVVWQSWDALMEYKGNAPLQFFGAAFVAIGLWRIIKKWRDS